MKSKAGSKYRYIIFDFDGTINNTAPGIVATFKRVLDMYRVDYSDVDFNKHIGPPLEYSFKELVGGDRWREALETYRRIFEETNAVRNSFLYDGIVDTLKKLYDEGHSGCMVAVNLEEEVIPVYLKDVEDEHGKIRTRLVNIDKEVVRQTLAENIYYLTAQDRSLARKWLADPEPFEYERILG